MPVTAVAQIGGQVLAKVVILKVSAKLGRHFWQRPAVALEAEDWDRLPDRFAMDPAEYAPWRELVDALTELACNERTRAAMGAAGPRFARRFAWTTVVQELQAEYSAVIAAGRRATAPRIERSGRGEQHPDGRDENP